LPWDRSNFAHHSSGPGARWPELARLRANSCSPHTPLFVSAAARADDYTLVPNEGVLLHCLAVRRKLSSSYTDKGPYHKWFIKFWDIT
jgi:hypothetical protein